MLGKKPQQRRSLLASASVLAAATAVMTGHAMAQDASTAAPAAAASDEEIVVTGSRIPQPNLTTSSPVTQLTAQDITTQGATRLEDMINQLPQAFADQNSTVVNGSTGTATVNLRGLGAARTLVLLDGRRMGYGSPNDSAADLNQIPGIVVSRVEVLTGGASAVYGSDAIAGVVNFIPETNFEGFRVDAQYGFFNHSNDYDGPGNIRARVAAREATNPSQFHVPEDNITNGYGKEISVMFGASTADHRGNVMAYASYRNNDSILQSQYDYSACSLTVGATVAGGNYSCGGSGTSATGQFTDFANFAFTVDQSVGDANIGTGQFRDFDSTLDQYNFGPLNYYQRPDERYSFGAFAHYEINRHFEVYGQLMHTDYKSDAQVAGSGDFGDTSTFNCADNALASASQLAAICDGDRVADITDPQDVADFTDAIVAADTDPARDGGPLSALDAAADAAAQIAATLGTQSCNNLFDDPGNTADGAGGAATPGGSTVDAPTLGNANNCSLYILRRNVEGGGRDENFRYESYRMVTGVRGELSGTWNYDLSATYSHVQLSDINRNYTSITRMKKALDVITGDGTGNLALGQIGCRSFDNGLDSQCVPWNIFSPGGVTAAALAYLQVPLMQTAETSQQDVLGTVTGELGRFSPFAQSAVGTSFGIEYRRDALDSTIDSVWQAGDAGGLGGPRLPLSGSTDVFEVFGEARVPLLEDMAFAKSATLDLAYRRSDYDKVSTDTYKVGLDWAPIDDIRFRGSFQHAVRAANIIELFTSQGTNLFDAAFDPCDAVNRPAANGPVPATCIGGAAYQVSVAQSLGGGLNSPAGQYQFLQGGNTNLKPEESDTKSFGIVFTPQAFPNFNLTVDYFDIKVDGLISTTGATNTLVDCYENGNLASCARITRNAVGQLWLGSGQVEDLNTNIGGESTSGVDVNANYSLPLGASTVTFSLIGTWLQKLETDPGIAGFPKIDCVGNYTGPCGTPNPEWRHRFRVGWETPWDLNLYATWRYIGEVQRVDSNNSPVTGNLDSKFDAINYLDLAGDYQILENTSLRFGVNNVLDQDPPISNNVGTTGNGNTYPQTYDSTGRWIFVGLTADF